MPSRILSYPKIHKVLIPMNVTREICRKLHVEPAIVLGL